MRNLGKALLAGVALLAVAAMVAAVGAGSMLLFLGLAGIVGGAGLSLVDEDARKAAASVKHQGVRSAFRQWNQERADKGKPPLQQIPRAGYGKARETAQRFRDRRRGRGDQHPPSAHDFKPGDPVHWVEERPGWLDEVPEAQDEGIVDRVDKDNGRIWARFAGDPDQPVETTPDRLKPGLLPEPPGDSNTPEHRWRRAYFRARRDKQDDPRKWADEHMNDRSAYADVDPDQQHDEDGSADEETNMASSNNNTHGKGSVAGEIADWETSQEARMKPETFIAWLNEMAAGKRYVGGMVEQMIDLYHGRGPSGHAGVPERILNSFKASYGEGFEQAAQALERFAQEYAAYVEEAEDHITQNYGQEVAQEAAEKHQHRPGGQSSRPAA